MRKRIISNCIQTMGMKEARHKIVHTLLFYLHKTQYDRKLTYAVRNQNIGYHCVGGGKNENASEKMTLGSRNILFLDLNFVLIIVVLV